MPGIQALYLSILLWRKSIEGMRRAMDLLHTTEERIQKVTNGSYHSCALRFGQRPKHRMSAPAATAIYWFPPTLNVIGDAFIKTLVGN
jgi:hypothetical protein